MHCGSFLDQELPQCTWKLPGPGIAPLSPALAGRLCPEPVGKSFMDFCEPSGAAGSRKWDHLPCGDQAVYVGRQWALRKGYLRGDLHPRSRRKIEDYGDKGLDSLVLRQEATGGPDTRHLGPGESGAA